MWKSKRQNWQRHLAVAQAWFMVGRIRRWWCKTAHQGSLGVCQEKPPNWHAHKFYSAHYTQTYTKIQPQTHRQIRIFQCAPTLKHCYIKHAAPCFSAPIPRASLLNNWWQRVVRGGTSDYNTAICYSSLSRCSVLLLLSELVHQSWNRILHFINPAEGSFQPHHNAPLMSEDSLM